MDKNFIRIDDLVRQHLEGAEENERGGAWLKMRDLLDQEMPQKKRIGIIYWRRIFGLVAAVSLIGTLAVGSYEFASAYKNLQQADAVAPITNTASDESGRIAMEMPVGEPENEPATSGNISVRANTHAARTAPVNAVSNNTTNNTTADNTTANNSTNNTSTNTNNTTNTTQNTNTQNTNTYSSVANNNVDDVNIRGSRIHRAATVAENNASDNTTGNNANSVATVNSKIVPSKPVTDDSRAGVKAGKRSNTTNKNTNVACATNNNNTKKATPAKTGKATEKAVAANNSNQKNTTNNVVNTDAAKTTASIAGAERNSTAVGTENTVARNEPAPSIPTNAGNKQDIGALNSSGPSMAATTPGTQAATTKELPKSANGGGAATGKTATSTAAKTNASKTGAAATTNGTAANYSGNVKVSATKKTATDATAKNTTAATGNKTAKANNATAATGTATKGAAKANNTAPASGAAKTAVASNSKTAGNGNSNLSGSVTAKRIAKGTDKATTATKPAAAKTTPAKTSVAANTAAATEEEEYEEEEAIVANDTKTAAKTGTSPSAKTSVATTKTATASNVGKTTTAAQKTASNSNSTGNAKAANNGKMAEKQNATSILAGSGGADDPDAKQEDKKTITKMVVREREVKNSDNEVMTAVDTLSMEKMNRGTAEKEEEETPATAGKQSANKNTTLNAGIAEPETAENKPESGSVKGKRKRHNAANTSTALTEEGTFAETEAAPAVAAAPAASEETAAAAAPAAEDAKTKAKSKKSGASLLNRMSAMFNDVKDHARGARPIAGITAGVNSNFFGPSKMMGFQFGMTGTMEFSETWSMMAELKYFHRVNSNTITDDYYTYTPNGGQYQRQLVQTSYDFAAAHNIEMPMTIRYAKGNFNFYTGPNLLYSFSINTARATLPEMTAPTVVSTMGNDNAPKYSDADFGSRFGLGYIFGFSYQVAPNTSLDLRNVQTVWDNASTTGAKSVSSMLYKTPSVQLSIMYRLGGHRNEE